MEEELGHMCDTGTLVQYQLNEQRRRQSRRNPVP